MYITRGTTPKHFFALPIVEEITWKVTITYTQAATKDIRTGKPITLIKEWFCPAYIVGANRESSEGITFSTTNGGNNTIVVTLSSAETNIFDPKHFVRVQITAVEMDTEKDPETGVITRLELAGDIHKSDIIYLAVMDDLANPYSEYIANEEETE